jgi:integrase/recombinase XerC
VPDPTYPATAGVSARSDAAPSDADLYPAWFTAFLHDRQTRKPPAHTVKAYRQDFLAIASLLTDGDSSRLNIGDITKDSMRTAFAAYAQRHEAASICRCWSTWNTLCTFLYIGEQLTANPMQLVGRPKLAETLPKALPRSAVEALVEIVVQDRGSQAKPIGLKAISLSFSLRSWRASAQTN